VILRDTPYVAGSNEFGTLLNNLTGHLYCFVIDKVFLESKIINHLIYSWHFDFKEEEVREASCLW
jgi:hypothetical protein